MPTNNPSQYEPATPEAEQTPWYEKRIPAPSTPLRATTRKLTSWISGVPKGGDVHDAPMWRQMAAAAAGTVAGSEFLVSPLIDSLMDRKNKRTQQAGKAQITRAGQARSAAPSTGLGAYNIASALQTVLGIHGNSLNKTMETRADAYINKSTLGLRMEAMRKQRGYAPNTPLTEAAREPYNSTAKRLLGQYPNRGHEPFSEVYTHDVNRDRNFKPTYLNFFRRDFRESFDRSLANKRIRGWQ